MQLADGTWNTKLIRSKLEEDPSTYAGFQKVFGKQVAHAEHVIQPELHPLSKPVEPTIFPIFPSVDGTSEAFS